MTELVVLPPFYKRYLRHGHIKLLIQGHAVFQWEYIEIDISSAYKAFNILGLTVSCTAYLQKRRRTKQFYSAGENASSLGELSSV